MLEAASGVLAIDKAAGWTSHDVVAVVRRRLGAVRVGHGGTLDPAATGVLPVLVGAATKSAGRFREAEKVYAAAVEFGAETTTDDARGQVRRTAGVPALSPGALDVALAPFRGEIAQVPPDFAAVKVAGRRAYDAARAGDPLVLGARSVRIARLEPASWRPPLLRLLIVCGSGTYVRSLARDLGRALGSAAHLAGLRRLAVGALVAEEACSIEALTADDPGSLVRRRLTPVDDNLLRLDERFMKEAAEDLLKGWPAA